jgi:aerotaxis receptor
MRQNLPISEVERPLPERCTLVSVTDLKGRITYCNSAFVDISGFTRDELLGQAHNIVRHPDMPEEAFRDLWQTIQSGMPWTGVVKNRCKNGDYYWVRANATPLKKGREIVGFISVRGKPGRDEIQEAENLYRRLRAEASQGTASIGLRRGAVVHFGIFARLRALFHPSARVRILVSVGGACAATVLAAALWPLWAAFAVAAGATALASWSILSATILPLARIVDDANRLASGDLSFEPRADQAGEIGQLQRALVQMTVNLRAVIAEVRNEVANLHAAIDEIASGNQDLSARTESQASSLEQTAASMEQVNRTIEHSADAAARSAQLADDTATIARRGHDSVQAAAGSMSEIEQSSRRINEIVEVVEGVSFQTNLLALNAAVEAARAGQQGRGFAVVAAEVRALAHRTATAAKEIRELIAEVNGRIHSGHTQSGVATSQMHDVVEAANNVSHILKEISASAAEQRNGAAQINSAVSHMDSITQQNAAMVEQLAASANAVREQVQSVASTMSLFLLTPSDVSLAETDAVGMRRSAKEHSAHA